MKNICVFCGAKLGSDNKYLKVSIQLGELIAKNSLNLVYGGSNSGLMGAVSMAATQQGGKVIGVYPTRIRNIEPFSATISDPILVDGMATRKEVMMLNSDAFIILPGGMGTLDELYEIITLKMLGVHKKPIIIINTDGYWKIFDDLAKHIVKNEFASIEVLESYTMVADPIEALQALGFRN